MDEQIKQISQRLQGLRESLELTTEDMAASCGLSESDYSKMESGTSDLSVSQLRKVARRYSLSLDELMFGEEPKMASYFLTRTGTGVSVERTQAYKYEALASGFKGKKGDPFIVTVEPKPENSPFFFNAHEGQEFNYVIEGKMLLNISGKELILNPGDSLYFDSGKPHGMLALGDKPLKFLAIIMQ